MSNKMRRVKTISGETRFVDTVKEAHQTLRESTQAIESYFTKNGEDTTRPELGCAKIITWPNSKNENRDRFYIRVYNTGHQMNSPYHSITTPEVNLDRRTINGNEIMYKWRVVTKEQFDLYVSFLLTKNPLAYTKLERELSNG